MQPAVTNITCVILNVCGLMTKLRSLDFDFCIPEYDLIFLTETKLDDLDIIVIDGFHCHTMNRTTFKYKSGGVGLLVKNSLSNTIEIVHGDTNCGLWFTSNVNSLGYEALWGVVYIPPDNSIDASARLFDDRKLQCKPKEGLKQRIAFSW